MQYFLDGYHAFRKKYFNKQNNHYKRLVKYGQSPKMLVIACSDSRVDPTIIMNCEPGDLFVVRNVANLVPPCEIDSGHHSTSAALEFGICHLDIKNILILGHTLCGGIAHMIQNNCKIGADDSIISKWMDIITPTCQSIVKNSKDDLETQIKECGQSALLRSFDNLLTFSWIAERFEAKTLKINLWQFDLHTGLINAYNMERKIFELLK
jgi:carbonic anhydrase